MSRTHYQHKTSNLLIVLVIAFFTLYTLFGKPQLAFATSGLEAFNQASDSYAREYCLNMEFGNSDVESQQSALFEFYRIFGVFSDAPEFSSSLETSGTILSKMMKQKKYKNVVAKKIQKACEIKEISLDFLKRQKTYKQLAK